MTADRPILRCTGRDHDDLGRAVGAPCGKTIEAEKRTSRMASDPLDIAPWRMETRDELVNRARAARWSIGPDGAVMCPSCRRPDPRTTAAIAELGRPR